MNLTNIFYWIAIVIILVVMAGLAAFVLILHKVTKSNYTEIGTIKKKENQDEDC